MTSVDIDDDNAKNLVKFLTENLPSKIPAEYEKKYPNDKLCKFQKEYQYETTIENVTNEVIVSLGEHLFDIVCDGENNYVIFVVIVAECQYPYHQSSFETQKFLDQTTSHDNVLKILNTYFNNPIKLMTKSRFDMIDE